MKVIIAGGGTGGHLFPGVAIAEEIRARHPDAVVTFVGTRRGIEARVLPELGWPLELIDVSGLKTVGAAGAVRGLFRLPRAYFQARALVKQHAPDAVIGVGGYASGPVVLAARMRGIPTAICEQNSIPGLTNKLLGRLARNVFLSFDESRRFFKPSKILMTGNPVRRDLLQKLLAAGSPSRVANERSVENSSNERSVENSSNERSVENSSNERSVENSSNERSVENSSNERSVGTSVHVLVCGGSLGAVAVNELASAALIALAKDHALVITHQTGEKGLEATRARYAEANVAAECSAFIKDMAAAYQRADLIIGRAGATTVAELAIAGKPAVFIPYPFAADNHQELNAREMAAKGAALMFRQSELTAEKLADALRPLLADARKRGEMGAAMKSLAKPQAAAAVADWCEAQRRP